MTDPIQKAINSVRDSRDNRKVREALDRSSSGNGNGNGKKGQ